MMAAVQVRDFDEAWEWANTLTTNEMALALPPSHRMGCHNVLHLAAARGGYHTKWDVMELWRVMVLKALPQRASDLHTETVFGAPGW